MATRQIIFGSRGSKLALAQTRKMMEKVRRRYPQINCTLKTISTTGDRVQDISLATMSAQGVFVREIEHALQSGHIDVAVHSLKDLPTRQPDGLVLAAIPEREDARDALYTATDKSLNIFAKGGVIGTSSVRRSAQIRYLFKNMRVADIRGNVDTRMRKVDEGQYDATVLAAAGLSRLGLLDRAARIFAIEELLPAPGQGALALEVRAGDDEIRQIIASLDDLNERAAVTAERAVLETLGSGCSLPLAAHACVREQKIFLVAGVFAPDGEQRVLIKDEDDFISVHQLGERVAKKLLAAGADSILQNLESYSYAA